ncbi:2-oxo-4-hydroxy-4-carboxy-5-ureidoimidazoline decarboxylase [Streptomyces sp. IBSBF 2435]|uniref:2-oxo-4-hydroxy-4-carboxy-5-ureidoimidazoline decarboxylase n=1 Tax=Streptomyces sp. IBSBF 2435 TaxID=2903531 RepID=UPI002FDBFF10
MEFSPRRISRTRPPYVPAVTDRPHAPPLPYGFALCPPRPRLWSPLLSSDTASDAPPSPLTRLNQAPPAAAEAALLACCGSSRWARRMAAHRPYPTVETLLAAADEAAYDLTPGDLAEALAGEAPTALTDRGGLTVHTALRAAHAHYEAKFGHAFILALDERTAADPGAALDQMLVSLRERLGHDEDEERVATARQLRRLCRARLIRLAGGSGEPGRPDGFDGFGRPDAFRASGASGGGPTDQSVRAFEAARSPDRAGSITPGPPRGTQAVSRRYDGRGRWTVPGRA